jgi:hypothetical protein
MMMMMMIVVGWAWLHRGRERCGCKAMIAQ